MRTETAASIETDAFERDVMEFADQLRGFIRRRVYHAQDAEDLAQEVFLKIFRSREALRDPDRLRAWVYRTARTTIADYFRRQKPNDPLPENLSDGGGFPNEAGLRMHAGVKRFVMTLAPKYRDPLVRAVFEGHSIHEIATDLGLSDSAIKSRLARGRAMVRQRMMECCDFDFDTYGKIIDLRRRGPCACEVECDETVDSELIRKPWPGDVSLALADEIDHTAILALLESAKLPIDDLDANRLLNFEVAKLDGGIIGCAGIEVYDRTGLLRSVAVAKHWQHSGLGQRLVREAESLASMLGIDDLYLLTTTAEGFFERLGFLRIDRAKAPKAIQESPQYTSLCPASAAFMHKTLCTKPARS